jgi:glyoxylase-like metal-dependent hydrolase (beta-lactamase superfamily II)
MTSSPGDHYRKDSHVTEVAEGIHRLTNGISNFYLIQESGKLVLVDAGAPKDWDLLGRAVAGLGRHLSDLDAVLLTHAHTDHIGFAEHARAATGARVWVHEHDAAMARTGQVGPRDGKTTAYLLRAAFWRTALTLGARGGARIIPVAEVSQFGDGQTLDVPGNPASCTPRATPTAAPPSCWRTAGSCSPGTCCARGTPTPAGPDPRSCRPA